MFVLNKEKIKQLKVEPVNSGSNYVGQLKITFNGNFCSKLHYLSPPRPPPPLYPYLSLSLSLTLR